MKIILILIFISGFFILSFFKLVKYINVKDSQHISCKLINKISLCIVASAINILVYLKIGLNFEYFQYFTLVIFITITAYIDYYTHYVYKIITTPMLCISIFYYGINLMKKNIYVDSLLIIFLIYLSLTIFSKLNWIGGGDVDVFVIISIIICKYSTLPLVNIILSMSISGVASIIILIINKGSLNYRKPLCPSIALATYIILFVM